MIVRILGEGQYCLPDEARGVLEALDSKVAEAIDAGSEASFVPALAALVAEVRLKGEPVPDDTFEASDLVVPFPDATVGETKGLLADSPDGARTDER